MRLLVALSPQPSNNTIQHSTLWAPSGVKRTKLSFILLSQPPQSVTSLDTPRNGCTDLDFWLTRNLGGQC